MRAVFARLRLHLYISRVGAGFTLGQGEGGELLAVHEARQPFFLLLFGPEKKESADPDRVMRVGEDRGRSATGADFLQHLAILHLGKATAADFFRRGHAENTDTAQAVNHVARDVGLAIDLLRIEVFVEKGAQFRDGAIDVGLLRVREPGIGHGPVGHEVSEEKPLGKAQFLPAAEEQFFGLLNFLLSLNVGFAKCHRWKPPANGRRATHCSKARPIVHPTAADQAPNRLTNS